jgi:hypothetical protein
LPLDKKRNPTARKSHPSQKNLDQAPSLMLSRKIQLPPTNHILFLVYLLASGLTPQPTPLTQTGNKKVIDNYLKSLSMIRLFNEEEAFLVLQARTILMNITH